MNRPYMNRTYFFVPVEYLHPTTLIVIYTHDNNFTKNQNNISIHLLFAIASIYVYFFSSNKQNLFNFIRFIFNFKSKFSYVFQKFEFVFYLIFTFQSPKYLTFQVKYLIPSELFLFFFITSIMIKINKFFQNAARGF